MRQGRRVFLGVAAIMAAASLVGVAQDPDMRPKTPGPDKDPFGPGGREAPRLNPGAIMKANQDTVKKDVARMAELTQQLQKELQSSDSKEVLSLDVLHKSEEIEKLAKEVKDLLRS